LIRYTSINETNQTTNFRIHHTSHGIGPSIHHDPTHLDNMRGGGRYGWQARGRPGHWGRGQGWGQARGDPTMWVNLQYTTITQPSTHFLPPTGPKYDFTLNPIITPCKKTTPHDTTAKIHWDIPDPLDRTNKGTQFGPTKHEGNDEPTDKPTNTANDQTGDNPEDPTNKVARHQDPTNRETRPPHQTNAEVTLPQHKTTKRADPKMLSDHQPTIMTRQKTPHKSEARHPKQPNTTSTMERGRCWDAKWHTKEDHKT
jgi:hypothetical protein